VRDAFIRRLTQMAERDPRICLVTGDLGFGVLSEFARRFPRQYLNAGVAEQNMTGLATGMALEGRIVFTYSIGNFPTLRCLEQIRNDACYHDANVKVVAIGGGFSYGALGMSHHATEDLSILRAIPQLTVLCPGNLWEAGEATEALVRTPGTAYLRLDKSTAAPSEREGEVFELGRARLVRTGSDVTLIASGGILGVALGAAARLADEGVECRVLSMHSLRPFDESAVVEAALQTGGIVTVEENTVHGGLGGAVAEACLEHGIHPRGFRRVGLRGGFSSVVGGQEYLRRVHGLDEGAVIAAVREIAGAPTREGAR
jgi:transketolase